MAWVDAVFSRRVLSAISYYKSQFRITLLLVKKYCENLIMGLAPEDPYGDSGYYHPIYL